MVKKIPIKFGPNTRIIISTSGRVSSLIRYQKLLQEVLKIDIAYIPIISDSKSGIIKPQDFAGAIKGMNAVGGAISKDIKHSIIPFLDWIDPLAKKAQSVNTVVRKNNKLKGYNTDIYGFKQAITSGIKRSKYPIKTAVVYGYGGILNTVSHTLNSLGIRISVTGRNIKKAKEKAKEIRIEVFDGRPHDLFINAAPVSDEPLIKVKGFLKAIKGSKLVFDHHMPGKYVYKYCWQHNIDYISGSEMYYPQMYKQWELFLDGIVAKNRIPKLINKAINISS